MEGGKILHTLFGEVGVWGWGEEGGGGVENVPRRKAAYVISFGTGDDICMRIKIQRKEWTKQRSVNVEAIVLAVFRSAGYNDKTSA